MAKLGLMGSLVAGGALGTFGVSFFTHLYFAWREPQMLGDGQYGMIFMGTFPLGWLLGSTAGAVIARRSQTKPRHAGWKGGALIMAGVITGPFVTILALPLIGLFILTPVQLLIRLLR